VFLVYDDGLRGLAREDLGGDGRQGHADDEGVHQAGDEAL
jgi:hypothetical protein